VAPGARFELATLRLMAVEAVATKRVLAWQIGTGNEAATEDKARHGTGASDEPISTRPPSRNTAVTLGTIIRAANVLGMKVILRVSTQRSTRRRV